MIKSDQRVSLNTKDAFLLWEEKSRDTIDVKRCYIDLAGDLVSGVLLSQIVYWFLPSKKEDKEKTTVKRENRTWLAKKREDWWKECRISPKQFDRAIKHLGKKELVFTRVFKFNGETMKHISINWDVFLNSLNTVVKTEQGSGNTSKNDRKRGENPDFPEGKILTSLTGESGLSEKCSPYKGISEITTKNKTTTLKPVQGSVADADYGGRDFVKKLLVGTVFHEADPSKILNVAKTYTRSQNEIEMAIDVLDQQYRQDPSKMRDPTGTSLLIGALRNIDTIRPLKGYIPRAQREAEAKQKREATMRKAEDDRKAKEAEDSAYKEGEAKLSALPQDEQERLLAKAKNNLKAPGKNSAASIKAEVIRMIVASQGAGRASLLQNYH